MPTGRDIAGLLVRGIAAKLLGKWLLIPAALLLVLALLSAAGLMMRSAGQDQSRRSSGCEAPGHNSQAVSANSGTSYGGTAKDQASQVEIIKKIDAGVKELGYSGKVTRLVSIAAMGESTLENISYGDNAINPDGSVADSIGILQQQSNWGSKEQRMDPKTAAKLFVLGPHMKGGGLADVANWESLSESVAINKVQINQDPLHYEREGRIQYTDQIIAKAGIDVSRSGKTHGDAATEADDDQAASTTDEQDTDLCAGSAAAGQPGGTSGGKDDYPITGIPGPYVYVEDGAGFYKGECTSYAMWRLAKHLGAKDANTAAWLVGNTKGGNGAKLGNGAEWRAGWEARGWTVTTKPTANSVAWWGAGGAQGIGSAGHVAWVDKVQEDGKTFEISEYNNEYLAPPGHKYSHRPAVTMDNPQAPNAFLVPPAKDKL